MKNYLSFGGGVNSTALMLLLYDRNDKFETIFVNHGGDYPETYRYVNYLRDQGFDITEIIPNVEGFNTIYDYCFNKQIIPSRLFRWCTDKFKIKPIHKYIDYPCTMFIGIGYDELKRAVESKVKSIHNVYPLVNNEMDRNNCIDLIRDNGLKIPYKSGCWFCPFMKRSEIRSLFINHRDLYDRVISMEHNCMRRDLYIKNKPFEDIAMSYIPPLSDYL